MTDAPDRFYKEVRVEARGDKYVILLDERPAKLSNVVLETPTCALADALAVEWEAHADKIDIETMTMSSMLAASLSSEDAASYATSEILQYLGTDLLCYRADNDDALSIEQHEKWAPYLDWFEGKFGHQLNITAGIVSIDQSQDVFDVVRAHLKDISTPALFALARATKLIGSAVMGLAVWEEAFAPERVFTDSRVDEHYQERKWGVDQEARAREAALAQEFSVLTRFISLLR